MPFPEPEKLLRGMFKAAVDAAMPSKVLPQHLPPRPAGRTIVVGAGKSAAAMARALEDNWDGPLEGLVVTRYGHGVRCRRIEVFEASHPVPDEAGVNAAERMLSLVKGLGPYDLVISLISGGGSSLLSLPAEGISLADKRLATQALLKGGVPISGMNCVRKHISAIKGGRLAAAAYPAHVINLIISDVPGDDPTAVASGPTVPDPTTREDALQVIRQYGVELPASVTRHLQDKASETPKPGDACFANVETTLIASAQQSLEAAAGFARSKGFAPLILGDAIEAEARELGFAMAGIAKQVRRFSQPSRPPCVLISGGETTVTVKGNGVGGRNVEFLLALALKLEEAPGIFALAADTDGIDGGAEVAGAVIDPTSLARACALNLTAWEALTNNDAHSFFAALGNQVLTGPTLTNVNDFRAILIT